jgi:UDPglucose 6-dehydrogenase
MGATVRAFDPAGMTQARALMPQVVYCESAYDCAQGVDALVIVTEWEQFRALDLERLRDLMATPVIIDLRNIYRPEELHRHGFAYASVGRPSDYSSSRGAGHGDDDFQIVTGTSTVAG